MKVAASPRVYIGRCPKAVFKSPVTSHFVPLIPRYQSLATHPCFQTFEDALFRIVIPSAALDLSCTQVRIT